MTAALHPVNGVRVASGIEELRQALTKEAKKLNLNFSFYLESEMGWLLPTDSVRQIHEHLPQEKVRGALCSARDVEVAAIIDMGPGLTPRIFAVMADRHAGGLKRTVDTTMVPLTDYLVPRLQWAGLSPQDVGILLVSGERYLELVQLAGDGEAARQRRLRMLNELDSKASARTAYGEIIAHAVKTRSTDVHICPRRDHYAVRIRRNGTLHNAFRLEPGIGRELVNILKLEAHLPIDEVRRPQDGRISLEPARFPTDVGAVIGGYSLRVSTIPTQVGDRSEKVVLRVLPPAKIEKYRLDALALPQPIVSRLKEIARSPHGMVLLTGPTSSGKTTTLYSLLQHLNTGEYNISTVEDPVEVRFPDIDQSQVNEQIDVTFSALLRAILRQDPDVILVGEIRDEETADIAVRAAQTGHFVLSTLHTIDAFSVIPRLKGMNVPPTVIQNALRAVAAQRLIRELCPECVEEYDAADEVNQILGEKELFAPGTLTLKRPRQRRAGSYCSVCDDSGYKGLMPVIELWVPNHEQMNRIIYDPNVTHDALAEMAYFAGMESMGQLALRYVKDGRTTFDEVISSVASIDELRTDRMRKFIADLFAIKNAAE